MPRDLAGLRLVADIRPTSGATLIDASGLGNVATAVNHATYSASDATLNGRPSLTFDGTNDHYTIDSIASHFSGTAKPYTVVVVGYNGGAAGNRDVFTVGRSSSGTPFCECRMRATTDIVYGNRRNDAGATAVVDGATPGATAHVFAWIYDGSNLNVYMDSGTPVDTQAASTGAMTIDQATIGCYRGNGGTSLFCNGTIGQVCVWNTALSAVHWNIVKRRFGSQFAIAVT
jgi:hypothetical protein